MPGCISNLQYPWVYRPTRILKQPYSGRANHPTKIRVNLFVSTMTSPLQLSAQHPSTVLLDHSLVKKLLNEAFDPPLSFPANPINTSKNSQSHDNSIGSHHGLERTIPWQHMHAYASHPKHVIGPPTYKYRNLMSKWSLPWLDPICSASNGHHPVHMSQDVIKLFVLPLKTWPRYFWLCIPT